MYFSLIVLATKPNLTDSLLILGVLCFLIINIIQPQMNRTQVFRHISLSFNAANNIFGEFRK